MNLYLFNDNDSASVYGIGTYIKAMTEALKGAYINVHIVNLRSIRPEFEIEKTENIEHWYIPEVRNENTFSGNTTKMEGYFLNVIYFLRLYIKDTKDLVFHFNYNTYHLLAKELKTIFICKTVTTVHFAKWMLGLNSNLSMLHTIKTKPQDIMSKFEKSLIKTDEYENLLYNEVDKVIALCHNMKDILQTEYHIEQEKIVVIPNGLADSSSEDAATIRKKWRILDDELLVLYAGRLSADKGVNYLIKAFHKVLKTIPNCRLMIAGSGDYNPYMKECEDIWLNVIWTGLLDKNKLYELYSIVDIGVMPSLHEQCSYVAIEMMMHGVPLVASTSSGLAEMVEEGVTGLQVSVIEYPDRVEIDSDVLAEKMLFLLQKSTKRKQMGRNARKRYERLYSSKVMRENMLDFYSSLLSC